jgi:hypothetical protein
MWQTKGQIHKNRNALKVLARDRLVFATVIRMRENIGAGLFKPQIRAWRLSGLRYEFVSDS